MDVSDIIDFVRTRLEDQSISDVKLAQHIAVVQADLLSRYDWPWQRRTHEFYTTAPVEVGDYTATLGQRTITEATFTLGAYPMYGHLVKLVGGTSGEVEYYRVLQSNSTNSRVVLDKPWPHATETVTVTLYADQYALPAGSQSVSEVSRRVDRSYHGVPNDLTLHKAPLTTGIPSAWAIGVSYPLPVPPTPTVLGTPGATYSQQYRVSYVDLYSGLEGPLSESSDTYDAALAPISVTTIAQPGCGLRLYAADITDDLPNQWVYVGESVGYGNTVQFTPGDPVASIMPPVAAAPVMVALRPIPNDTFVYSCEYIAGPPEKTTYESEIIIPDQFATVLLDGVQARVLMAEREDQRAAMINQSYERGIRSMIRRVAPNTTMGVVGGGLR